MPRPEEYAQMMRYGQTGPVQGVGGMRQQRQRPPQAPQQQLPPQAAPQAAPPPMQQMPYAENMEAPPQQAAMGSAPSPITENRADIGKMRGELGNMEFMAKQMADPGVQQLIAGFQEDRDRRAALSAARPPAPEREPSKAYEAAQQWRDGTYWDTRAVGSGDTMVNRMTDNGMEQVTSDQINMERAVAKQKELAAKQSADVQAGLNPSAPDGMHAGQPEMNMEAPPQENMEAPHPMSAWLQNMQASAMRQDEMNKPEWLQKMEAFATRMDEMNKQNAADRRADPVIAAKLARTAQQRADRAESQAQWNAEQAANPPHEVSNVMERAK